MAVDYARINNTLGKFEYHLATHEHPFISVSGGSDSDVIVHMIATNFKEYLGKTKFCFVNTGLEYRATIRHLDFLEERYGIHIERIRGVSVVNSVHQYGVPVLSKTFSFLVDGLQRGKAWAYKQAQRGGKYGLTNTTRAMADYLVRNGIKVSDKCCTVSKKKPLFKKEREWQTDLSITGERKAEGGRRAVAHTDCFEENTSHGWDKYTPLFFWDDETKQWYKEKEKIVYSDCYEVWGMKRTGCVGCPFNSRVGKELETIKQHEPSLYRACMNVFGESYRVMDMFGVHRRPIEADQITF